ISRNTWRRAKRYSDLRQYFPSRTYTEPSPTSTQSSAKYPGTHRRSLLENLTTLSVTPICRRSCLSCFGRPSRKVSRSGVLSRIEKRTEGITGYMRRSFLSETRKVKSLNTSAPDTTSRMRRWPRKCLRRSSKRQIGYQRKFSYSTPCSFSDLTYVTDFLN